MILHLFKKDVRHSRILLAVWLLLVALQCALIGSSARPGDLVLQGIYLAISVMVPLFQALVLVVIIPQLVQEEPQVGTIGFWFTRPISRSALLQSKALFVAMLIALPLLAEVGVLAANGVTSRDIGLAIPEIILNQVSLILSIGVLAVLTPNFGRFAIVGAVAVVGLVLVNTGITWLKLFYHPDAAMAATMNFSLIKSRMVTENLLVVLAAGAVIVHQYLTRKTARSILGAVIGGALAIAVLGFWPWDFLAPPPPPDSGVKFDAAAVKVELGRAMVQDISALRGVGEPLKSINTVLQISGLPAGYVVTCQRVQPQLAAPDGTALKLQKAFPVSFSLQPNPEAIEDALGGIPVVNSIGFPTQPTVGLFKIDANLYGQYARQPLKFSVAIDFAASRYRVIAELPLVRGAHYDNRSEHAVITDVLRQGNSVEIVLQQRNVQLLFDRESQSANPAAAMLNRVSTVYLLRNRTRNEAVFQKQDFGFDLGTMASAIARRLVQKTVSLSFGPEQNRPAPDLTEAWLADAELVRLDLVPMAEFSKTLTDEKFRLQGNYATPRGAAHAPDSAQLAKIELPEPASKAQVREYIDAALTAAQRQRALGANDPVVEKLVKVGPGNLDVLIDAASENSREFPCAQPASDPAANWSLFYLPYLNSAINQLAEAGDKALILDKLSADRYLADLVVKFGWASDARNTLLSGLRDESQLSLPPAWIQAVASLRDPATYPALEAYLVRGSNKQLTFNAIRRLPGIDLAQTAELTWKKSRYSQPILVVEAAGVACEFGHLDALETVVDILKNSDGSQPNVQRRAAAIVRRYLPATGGDDDLIAWFEANQGHLVFDAKRKKFLPQPAQ
jgi:hypothetical protein